MLAVIIRQSMQRKGASMENLTKQERNQLKKVLSDRGEALREDIRREISLQNEYAEVASEEIGRAHV